MAENIPQRGRRDVGRQEDDAPPKAPKHLSTRTKGIWALITAGWHVDAGALPLLQGGLEHLDLHDVAIAILKREGLTITNPATGLTRAHPATKIAADALREYRACWRALGLEPEA